MLKKELIPFFNSPSQSTVQSVHEDTYNSYTMQIFYKIFHKTTMTQNLSSYKKQKNSCATAQSI